MIPAWLYVVTVILEYVLAAVTWYALGKRAGLRAPLTARQAVLRAEVRRAENALGVTLPRVRSARYSRRTGRRKVE